MSETQAGCILIVDDNREMRDLLGGFLKREGYVCLEAADGVEMRRQISRQPPDLVLLDIMLPGEDGLSLCRWLRADSTIPVIMLTARGDDIDRILGLEMGADDYLSKPFNSRELLARIRAVLRRTQKRGGVEDSQPDGRRYGFDGWCLDLDRQELQSPDGVLVSLGSAEFRLLRTFVEKPGRVLSRSQLLDLCREGRDEVYDRSIDTLVSRLRRKIEADPRQPQWIKTVWGGGYQFCAQVEQL